jgi:hypothetical protein
MSRKRRSQHDPWGNSYDIHRDGHRITGGADRLLTVPTVEMTDGKLFNHHGDRIHVLALLLESVGIDAAARLGPPELWRQAIAELPATPGASASECG